MSSELSILAIYGLLVVVTVLLNVLTALPQVGLMTLGGPRDTMPPLQGAAARVSRTLENSVVAMALFAPAVLLLAVQEAFTPTTLLAAQIFLVARIAYVPIYVLGISVPFLRTLVWMAGFLASAYLLFAAI